VSYLASTTFGFLTFSYTFFSVASAFPVDEYTKDNCSGFLTFLVEIIVINTENTLNRNLGSLTDILVLVFKVPRFL
jgi:hypothetical protein